MYEKIEAANMCCAIKLPRWKNSVNIHSVSAATHNANEKGCIKNEA